MTHPAYLNVTTETQGGLFCTDPIEASWQQFHERNPQVYAAFERLTLRAIAGEQKMGAKAVWERMRWDFHVESSDKAPKLNNNFTAYYARHFMALHPQHANYFQLREIGKRRET